MFLSMCCIHYAGQIRTFVSKQGKSQIRAFLVSFLGKTCDRKKRFNSGIARITQPPQPPIRATFPTFSAVDSTRDHLRDFYLVKKTVQKNRARVIPPHFRAMPEFERF